MRYLLLIALMLMSPVFAGDSFQNVRLTWTENPQSQATISWESDESTEGDLVKVWQDGQAVMQFAAEKTKAYTDNYGKKKSKKSTNEKWFYRHVRLVGLKASTKYKMTAHSKGATSREFYFTTAPKDGRDFKLLYVGDSRTRVEIAAKICQQMSKMTAQDPEILAVIHGGDYANTPSLAYWRPWLAAWNKTTGQDGKLLPLIPVVGNHEQIKKSPLYGEAYGMPGGDKNFLYSCKLSPSFRIVVLNSEIPSTGTQEDFLKETLQKYRDEKVKWQLVAFHRPVYPAVKKPSVIKRLVPLFDEFNIDLVLESDGHCIKRTLPIKNDKHDPQGVVYLGEGGFGAPQRKPKDLWYLKTPGFASLGDHLMSLHVTSKSIDYQAVGVDDKVLDQHKFLPKNR
jgi:acid phosphatase type 7